jgi:short-subunit dehydrogenase
MDPTGKTVIITGASSGIGAAAAQAFAAAGADVVLVARSRDKLEQIANTLPGKPLVIPADVSHANECHHIIEQVVAQRGRVDILVNNAGVGIDSPVLLLEQAAMQQVFAVNLFAPLHLTQAVAPVMQAQGKGQIINVSSVVGHHTLPYAGGYAASKAALDRLTEAMRMELDPKIIAVTLVRPGTTRTSFGKKQLGNGQQVRRFVPGGVSPATVAQTLIQAAHREPRTAYVSLRDKLQVMLVYLIPGLVASFLRKTFRWETRAESRTTETL